MKRPWPRVARGEGGGSGAALRDGEVGEGGGELCRFQCPCGEDPSPCGAPCRVAGDHLEDRIGDPPRWSRLDQSVRQPTLLSGGGRPRLVAQRSVSEQGARVLYGEGTQKAEESAKALNTLLWDGHLPEAREQFERERQTPAASGKGETGSVSEGIGISGATPGSDALHGISQRTLVDREWAYGSNL